MRKKYIHLSRSVLSTMIATILFIFSFAQHISAADVDNSENLSTIDYLYDTVKFSFKITDKWSGGYNAYITIENISSETLSNWEFALLTSDNIVSIWNAEIIDNTDGCYTIRNAGWNKDIPAGNTIDIGMSSSSDFVTFPQINLIKKSTQAITSDYYSINYQVDDNWNQGFTGHISITNLSDTTFESWRLSFDCENTITNLWDAQIISCSDNHYILEGFNYNQDLAPNNTICIGFEVNNGNPDNSPLNLELSMRGLVTEIDNPDIPIQPIDPTVLSLYSNEESFWGNESGKEIIFYAKTNSIVSKALLYDMTNNIYIEMFDNGNYQNNGDDMQGDGIYSARYTVYTSSTSDIIYQFKAIINDTYETETIEIQSYAPLTDEELSNIDFVQDFLHNLLNSDEEVYEDIPDGGTDGGTYASEYEEKYAKYYNSLQYLLDIKAISYFYFEESEKQFIAEYVSGGKIIIPLSYCIDMYDDEDSEIIPYPQIDSPYIGCRIAILNAFEDRNSRNNYYTNLVTTLESNGANVTYDNTVNVFEIKKLMSDKDIICFCGHGCVYGGNPCLRLIDDKVTTDKSKYEYQLELKSGYLCEIWDNDVCYAVNGYYIRSQFKNDPLSDSMVYLQSCNSMGNQKFGFIDTFAKGFLDVGASNVVGFYNSVMSVYNRAFMSTYILSLLDGKTALESFEYAKSTCGNDDFSYRTPAFINYLIDHDVFDKMGPTAFPKYCGDPNVSITKSLMNGDFETVESLYSSKPYKWTSVGDVRVLNMLGDIKAHQSQMVFISTGIGASESSVLGGPEGSLIKQTFYNRSSTSITFVYDFISEEPLEFVGSRYNDQFYVRIRDVNNNILHSEKVEEINTSTWYPLSGVDFDGGDHTVYHTLWKELSIDISAYQGQYIQIEFVVCDVGDSSYDSAVIIDDICCN